jgi:hypothetical protein
MEANKIVENYHYYTSGSKWINSIKLQDVYSITNCNYHNTELKEKIEYKIS